MAAPNHLRRMLLRAILAAPLPAWSAAAAMLRDVPGQPLPAWQPGWLDIHHIATGRGNASFVQFPDGTSLLVDAGASLNGTDVSMATRAGTSRRAGKWIGRYVRRHLGRCGLDGLDPLLVTHLHPDHVGDVEETSPRSRRGPYRLSGVTDVAEQVTVRTLIDRGFPDYDFPSRFVAPFTDNYRACVTARMQNGLPVERFYVGSATQIAPRGTGPRRFRSVCATSPPTARCGRGRAMLPPMVSSAGQAAPHGLAHGEPVLGGDPHRVWAVQLLHRR
jgi:hypothetical protein